MRDDENDRHFMTQALTLAASAAALGEVPVGCILVDAAGAVIATGENRRERTFDPTAHAEVVAVRAASELRQSYRLLDLTAYVTLEPCAMCAGALVNARVARVVYACADPKAGAIDSHFGVGKNANLNHTFAVTAGVLEDAAKAQLRAFFEALRASGKNGRRGPRIR